MTNYNSQSTRDKKTIARILKVNHAGEYGAIRIYRSQAWLARRLYPEIRPFLEETLAHEIQHCDLFYQAMQPRETRPCRIMALWGNGGYILGFLTGIFGKQSIWICTSAVEATVHKHLEDQLKFLDGKDKDLQELIESIQEEEFQHLTHANNNITHENLWSKFLRTIINNITDMLIWLSTWGDSSRMARDFHKTTK